MARGCCATACPEAPANAGALGEVLGRAHSGRRRGLVARALALGLTAWSHCTVSASWSLGPNSKPCRCAGCWRHRARAHFVCPPSKSSRSAESARPGGPIGCARGFRFHHLHQRQCRAIRRRLLEQKRELALAAMGPATARALNQAGYRVVGSAARKDFDSESLLRHPKLNIRRAAAY